MSESNIHLSVPDGTTMRAYVSRPSGDPKGGIIVFQEAFGVNGYIRSIADRFAAEGYLVIAPEIFHRTAPEGWEGSYGDFEAVKPHYSAVTVEKLQMDARAAYDWLTGEGGIPAEAVNTVGFCLGGRVAFLANAALPIRRAVSFYGGGLDTVVDLAPQLHGEQLFLWGGKDTHITSDKRQAVIDGMDAAGKPYVMAIFSEAEHGFFCDARLSFDEASARAAWPFVLGFLA